MVRAAAKLLSEQGPDAVSTRAVSTAAGVQPPAIYRLFGDKDGLLDAVASHGLHDYLLEKQALYSSDDPIEDVRRAWDLHVAFGLAQPAFYILVFGNPSLERLRPARREAYVALRRMVGRIADVGRLSMSVDRATALLFSTSVGTVLTLLSTPPGERDPGLSALAWDSALRAVTSDLSRTGMRPGDLRNRAAALREALPATGAPALTPAENTLLVKWLDRLANGDDSSSA